jgi:hypothetical protein
MPIPTPPTNEVPPVVTEPVVDDFGYAPIETPADPAAPPAAVLPVVAPATPPAPEIDDTGYGDPATPPAPAAPPVAPEVPPVDPNAPPVELTAEEKTKKEITDTINALDAGYDKVKVTKFVTENNLTKAQLDAYVAFNKAEDAAFVKQQSEAKIAQRAAWKADLQRDPDFGGEHFVKNVALVNKVLANNMPNLKKFLTDNKGVLPPYIMKDLLGLSKTLNPITKLIGGEPPAPPEESESIIDIMYK